MLTRDAILALTDTITEEYFIDEWKDSVLLKTLTGEDRLFVDALNIGADQEDPDSLEKIVVLGTYGEDGQRLFTLDDVPELKKKSIKVIQELARKILVLNGFLDDAEKNSEPAPL